MEKNWLAEARKELNAERSPFEKAVDWAKGMACKYNLVPDSIACKWDMQQEAEEHYRVEDIRDRIHAEWERSPEGRQWEREQEELAHFGKVLTATDYAEKRADLENDPTIDRGDINWMMEKWAGNPKWREIADRDNEVELIRAIEGESRMVEVWAKSPEGKQHLQEQEGRMGNPPTEKPRDERTFSIPAPTGDWPAAKLHLEIPDKVRDVCERDAPKNPQQQRAKAPTRSSSKPKDRDLDMEM